MIGFLFQRTQGEKSMSLKLLHLSKQVELGKDISLPNNCFYIGKDLLNLEKSLLYKDLCSISYKQWLWSEIKAKTNVYRQLVKIKNFIIMGYDLSLVCYCDVNDKTDCNGETLKKALLYLLEQQKLSAKQVQASSLQEYIKASSIADEQLHDFCYWLEANKENKEKLNFYELWISFILQRQVY